MLKLYYYPSNASTSCHFILAELNFEYELILVDRDNSYHKSPEYLLLNPTGRIPTLIDNDLVLFESAAICIYLSEKDSNSLLIPQLGDNTRAKFYQWIM
jgi:glutathione S-transferase